jgi:hypothetical protein
MLGGAKRRATAPMVEDLDLTVLIRFRTDINHRAFITLPKDAQSTLRTAREEIHKHRLCAHFLFWYPKLGAFVQENQEAHIKVTEALDGQCLVIDPVPFDPIMAAVDDQITGLWAQPTAATDKLTGPPSVPLRDVIRALFQVYKVQVGDSHQLNVIQGGICHFLANITKNSEKPDHVTVEDFKLFLKFFGPPEKCLQNVSENIFI